jgi:uncharacterized protein YndB with AHSA1/START domain
MRVLRMGLQNRTLPEHLPGRKLCGIMRIVIIVVAILVTLVVLVLVIGALLPKTHIATRTVVLNAPAPAVWKAITTVEAYPQWRGVQAAVALPPRAGRRVWRETDKHGQAMTMEVIEEVPERRLVTRIADEHLPFGGTWTYELVPLGNGTQVTIIEDGVIHNPVFRCMARYVIGYHATMDDYLARLKTRTSQV